MSIRSNGEWPLVVLILGVMAIGATLVATGHKDGWWLIILPVLCVFL